MTSYLATVELAATHPALLAILQQWQEQLQLLVHCYDDSNLHDL
jgi:predicted protein tyrosine phosphatase